MTRTHFIKGCAALISILAAASTAAQTCPDLAGASTLESDRYVIAYRTKPDRIAVGQHFSMDLVVCAKSGQPTAETLRVDAQMPEHRHGMNYRASVKGAESGRFHAEGFMFHMPGQWEFIFEVRSAGKTDRATRSVTLE